MKKHSIDLAHARYIHCIGIGGSGLSGLASILSKKGHIVSGVDRDWSSTLERLKKEGLEVALESEAPALPNRCDALIYSLAVAPTHSILKQARQQKIPLVSYPEAVGELTRQHMTIAVCGTHGKSTITALLAKLLIDTNFDPNVIVGTTLHELNEANYRVGKSKLLVLEACEYKRAFLNYSPRVILLNTLDPDHLDYYKDFDDYISAFEAFVLRLSRDGYFFANLDDDDVHRVVKTLQNDRFPTYNIFTYSTRYNVSDFYLQNEETVIHKGKPIGKLSLQIPGHHNRANALGAFAVGATLGIAPRDILKSLHGYRGAARRFEKKGTIGKTLFFDDYGHHPVEVQATLAGAREMFPKARICVVFQPHQFSRTRALLGEFVHSFNKADSVVIPNIYEARDTAKDKAAISAEKLVAAIAKEHSDVRFGDGLDKTAAWLKKNASKFDVVITMGAGDVWKIHNLRT